MQPQLLEQRMRFSNNGVESATSKSSIGDATSRTYGFDIQQSARRQPTTTTSTTTPGPGSLKDPRHQLLN